MIRFDLDAHATTPLHPAAAEAMVRVYAAANGNPASPHYAGRQARRALDDARELVAHLVGAHASEVVFTSGATEANNLAVFGQAGSGAIVASRLEHPCVSGPVEELARRGQAVVWAAVTPQGRVDGADLLGCVTPHTTLVCLQLASHETGAVQPVREVASRLPGAVRLHTDAAQAVGKMSVQFHDLNVTTLSLSGHKFGGPKGVGALLVRTDRPLQAQSFGGHQQAGRRPGTEPVALAVGLAAALEVACAELTQRHTHLNQLRTRFLHELEAHAAPVIVNGPRPGDLEALPSCLNLSFPGCRADLLVARLDLAGVHCSTGAACASGSLLPSPTLVAMNLPAEVVASAVRFSFGPTLSSEAGAEAAERVIAAVRAVRG